MSEIQSCICGCKDLTVFWEVSHGDEKGSRTVIDKIHCPDCKRSVRAKSNDAIWRWNRQQDNQGEQNL